MGSKLYMLQCVFTWASWVRRITPVGIPEPEKTASLIVFAPQAALVLHIWLLVPAWLSERRLPYLLLWQQPRVALSIRFIF